MTPNFQNRIDGSFWFIRELGPSAAYRYFGVELARNEKLKWWKLWAREWVETNATWSGHSLKDFRLLEGGL